jgi:hypothetical protein
MSDPTPDVTGRTTAACDESAWAGRSHVSFDLFATSTT